MKGALLLLAALAAATGCATAPGAVDAPADAFLARLSALCGRAFEGRVVTGDAADADMAGKRLVMHVCTCSPAEVRVPFHVGEDRSRTWIVTRVAGGLRLKHDHRHRDGSPDAVTLYGGDTATPGAAGGQAFPVDAGSVAMFRRAGLVASVTNVWAMEIDARRFAYALRRAGRHLRVEFDLTRPVAPPPPPWGSGDGPVSPAG